MLTFNFNYDIVKIIKTTKERVQMDRWTEENVEGLTNAQLSEVVLDLQDYVDHAEQFKIQAERELRYLADTADILVGYDGYSDADDLKRLVDETRERIAKVVNHDVTREDLGE